MILNGANSDDYLYLRLISDMKMPGTHATLKAGTVVRLNLANLRESIWKSEVREKIFERELDFFASNQEEISNEKNQKKDEISRKDFLPSNFFGSVTIKNDLELFIEINPNDLICINDELRQRLDSEKFSQSAYTRDDALSIKEFNQTFFDNGILTSSNNTDSALVPLNPQGIFEYLGKTKSRGGNERPFDGGNVISESPSDIICVPFKAGEVVNLRDLWVALLFLNQEYLRFLGS